MAFQLTDEQEQFFKTVLMYISNERKSAVIQVLDSEEAKTMNENEVRAKFPRLHGLCPKGCGYNGIGYASMEHYVMGDW